MTKVTTSTERQLKWVKPEIASLDMDVNHVKNGFMPGSDGDGGYSTSMS